MHTCRQGEEIAIYDGRPTTEMLLARGDVQASNPSDYLTVQAGLVAADRLYMQKKQVRLAHSAHQHLCMQDTCCRWWSGCVTETHVAPENVAARACWQPMKCNVLSQAECTGFSLDCIFTLYMHG